MKHLRSLALLAAVLLGAASCGTAYAGLETATYINGLVVTNPTATDPASQGDDHIRLLKSTAKNTWPNVTGAVTASHTELNYVTGVTSAIQTQLDAKALYIKAVLGSNYSTSTASLGNMTGMSLALAASSTYLVAANMTCGSNSANGYQLALAYSGTGTIEAGVLGTVASATALNMARYNTFSIDSTSGATATFGTSAQPGPVWISGVVSTTTAGNLTMKLGVVTSGNATCYTNSNFYAIKLS